MMIGISFSFFISLQAEYPSSFGIIISMMIRSKSSILHSETASRPSAASETS